MRYKFAPGIQAVVLAGTLAFGNGCVSLGARPHTTGENLWFGAATAAHAADLGLTKYGTDNGWRYESNILYGENSSIEKMILIKTAYLGLTYGLGEAFPEQRGLLYKISTIWGAFPMVVNLSRILFTSPENN